VQTRTGVLFSRAAEEWLRCAEHDRACKPTTMRDYRRALAKDLLPAFGDLAPEDITRPMIEALPRPPRRTQRPLRPARRVRRRTNR